MRRLVAVGIVLVLAACTAQRTPVTSAPADADRRPVAPDSRAAVAAALRTGDYAGALAAIRAERGRSPGSLSAEYVTALQSLAADADRRLRQDDPAAAGRALRILLDHYPVDANLAARLGRPRHQLQAQLEACADRVLDRGLVHYRAGDLASAIRVWKQILLFSPGHPGASKNIETAELQLQKLQSLR